MIFSETIIVEIKIPLDIVFITSQNKRENILDELIKLKASTILSLNKGKRPIFQDFK